MNVMTKAIQGKTIHYTRLGLGLAALGRPGYITLGHGEDLPPERTQEAMLLHAMGVLDAAWAAGVRYYDVARSYGAGELFLNTWLRIRNIGPDQVTVGSKWGYTYTAQWKVQAEQHEVKDHSLATLRRQIGESLTLLGPWLRLYQIHSATLESGVMGKSDVLDELARLRDGGLVMGVSVSGVKQAAVIEKALTITRGGVPVFGSVQATWNLLERSAGAMLAEAHRAGWLVIIKEGLANGRLASRGLPADSPLFQLGERYQQSVDSLALAAVLDQPWADVVLSGAATKEQLLSNLKCEQSIGRLEEGGPTSMMQQSAEEYWRQRSTQAWN
jgi:aryl-alcohol dehydrogenase-like predicted oxidoreductase